MKRAMWNLVTGVAVVLLGVAASFARDIPDQPHIYGKCVEKSAAGKCVKSDQDISPAESYRLWEEKQAEIVDVRTPAEFKLIGHPGSKEKKELLVRGKPTGRFYHPSIAINMPYPWFDMGYTGHEDAIEMGEGDKPEDITEDETKRFIAPFAAHFQDKGKIYIFIDRSWDRAIWAANLIFQQGYKNVYTVIGGFEGHPNATDGYRRTQKGWLFENLPYSYDIRH